MLSELQTADYTGSLTQQILCSGSWACTKMIRGMVNNAVRYQRSKPTDRFGPDCYLLNFVRLGLRSAAAIMPTGKGFAVVRLMWNLAIEFPDDIIRIQSITVLNQEACGCLLKQVKGRFHRFLFYMKKFSEMLTRYGAPQTSRVRFPLVMLGLLLSSVWKITGQYFESREPGNSALGLSLENLNWSSSRFPHRLDSEICHPCRNLVWFLLEYLPDHNLML